VYWGGDLEIRLSDGPEIQNIEMADISGVGARFFIPRVYVRGRYLLSDRRPSRMVLRIDIPAGPLEMEVAPRWYRWSVEANAFEMAVAFTRIQPDQERRLEGLLAGLRKQAAGGSGSLLTRTFPLLFI
jgi:hypothetical protein